ncbi:MAG: Ribonuclease 3 [Candidatus Collierbacteria bacterium GW2011_GWB1_44_6]|uniref:Ribonuclease 3 n=2 Tax=Candidatus Collieribacteriota TaxID=1752725 RepID=A0A0G1JPV1_9BACT|nr:MAG: Ribonuclease 3 [Candidatus Collierbacteria bacterium GW2011_GWC2_43_12]KKT73363.1 MAG: Ribonuclease 3 [Candidatus Collierbacteria bacterium GW2011_GWB1_44_6]
MPSATEVKPAQVSSMEPWLRPLITQEEKKPPMNRPNLKLLQEIIDYEFRDPNLLETALTHRSCLNQPGIIESYERLEFLGDAILEMLISVYLFNKYPDKMEGYLTAARSAIVRTESLSKVSEQNHINDYIRMSKGEEATGGRKNSSILEDVIESLIGALFLDGGLEAAKAFFERLILPNAKDIIALNQLKDSKSLLQEKVQSQGLQSPVYQTINEVGLDHNKTFEVAVFIDGKQLATGKGKNKQEAEQKAATAALITIDKLK